MKEILDFIIREIQAGILPNPVNAEHRAWNEAHERILKIVFDYQEGKGNLQKQDNKMSELNIRTGQRK